MYAFDKRSCKCPLSIIVLLGVLLVPAAAVAQSCNDKGHARSNTSIYDRLPYFSTASGWNYGNVAANLERGTLVYICHREEVSFGFSRQKWYQISYYLGGRWQYGWVLGRDIDVSSVLSPGSERSLAAWVLPEAHAQPPTAEAPPASLGPPPMPANNPPSRSPAKSAGEHMDSGLMQFYITAFIVMVAGMIAKAFFDYINSQETRRAKEVLQQAVVPVLVSPIVFLGLMQTSNLTTTTATSAQAYMVFLCIAFQNGFFWQTLLGRRAAKTGN